MPYYATSSLKNAIQGLGKCSILYTHDEQSLNHQALTETQRKRAITMYSPLLFVDFTLSFAFKQRSTEGSLTLHHLHAVVNKKHSTALLTSITHDVFVIGIKHIVDFQRNLPLLIYLIAQINGCKRIG